ncbi:hypothetical protein AB6A40_008029 [Gnathostoma spinigerum]|uniref:2-methoxy-6-polyprenyl-1,4-benzoquinol methylase, mitochondrial n=1 Tax=Gnathostoma spinigerum TaxID=75299 RepID=A0ABD6EMX2_9BILA
MSLKQAISISRHLLSDALKLSGISIKNCFRSASTHFGFEEVDEDEKAKKVASVFTGVAEKYDLMNDAMSLGIHRLWKDYYIYQLNPNPNTEMLDIAGGTGDIAFRALRRIQKREGKGSVTVFDINQEMLEVGKHRAESSSEADLKRLKWIHGDAESMPFNENSFDLCTMAFGIRNCTHIDKVLTEAYRVLRPGGRFSCLEFSRITPSLKLFYDFYSFQIIPVMGQVIAGDYDSYRYLVESIRRFPDQEKFASMFRHAGFKDVGYENLTFGICAIHTGYK